MRTDAGGDGRQARPEVVAADALEGERVVNRRGELLGTIEEVMVDVRRGTVAYAVLSRGGAGGKLFAVPWRALAPDPARQAFVLDAEPARFDQAAGFDRDHWPSMADTAWAFELHDYYGVEPYWARALPPSPPAAA